MTRDPITIAVAKDAAQGADMLIKNDIGGMPVVDKDGMLIGQVTKFDFVKIIAKEA
jgi:Mg/Co/Ni transporter MgtE